IIKINQFNRITTFKDLKKTEYLENFDISSVNLQNIAEHQEMQEVLSDKHQKYLNRKLYLNNKVRVCKSLKSLTSAINAHFEKDSSVSEVVEDLSE
ncbi:MAG: hypothetical protein MHPSP_003996, partial [Paramarteilia canceri]